MFKKALDVTYSPIKNNFVLLPEIYLRLINTYPNSALQLSFKAVNHCVSWLPFGGAVESHQIGMSAVMAEVLGLKEGDSVTCSLVADVKSLTSINVSPVNKKDLDVLQLSPTKVQNELLDQIRIVNRGQIIVAWISRSIFLQLKVDYMQPNVPVGRLENNSQLIIITTFDEAETAPSDTASNASNNTPLSRSSTQASTQSKIKRTPSDHIFERVRKHLVNKGSIEDLDLNERVNNAMKRNLSKKGANKRNSFAAESDSSFESPPQTANNLKVDEFNGILNGLKKSMTMADMKFREYEDQCRDRRSASTNNSYVPTSESWTDIRDAVTKETNTSFEFRVIPGKWEDDAQISTVFITKENLIKDFDTSQVYLLKTNADKEYFVNTKLIKDDKFPTNIYPTIEINENLLKILDLKKFERVVLKPKQGLTNRVDKIELINSSKIGEGSRDSRKIETAFKNYIIDNTKVYPLLLNQDQVMRINEFVISVKLWPTSLKFALIDSKILRENKIETSSDYKTVAYVMNIEPEKEEEEQKKKGHQVEIGKFEKVVNGCVDRLKESLCLGPNNTTRVKDNLLFIGPASSGKTTIINKVLKKLSGPPFYCYINKFCCVKNKGRKADSIQRDLRQAFNQCLLHYPSILVLDTLDYLTQTEGEQPGQDADYYNKVSDLVRDVITEYTETTHITVIATATNIENLNKRIFPRKGYHIFHKVLPIPQLDKADRELFIKESCLNAKIKDRKLINWEKFANLTDGYKIGDLAFFIERSIYYAYKKNPREPTLTDENLRDALRVTNEIFLQGIESHSSNELEEADIPGDQIPGLEKAIEIFEEVIKWPAEFPSVFEKSPIKLPKGILLYGPPGVGKTFFVRQIAKTWSLRMISVKGPELLAKYIGQSEENVRNLFQKARAAKPCILFFDEFDSLAPRRGSDSTGVTDRVVNQFLTQLDGVEELQGVIIVAATSRPELLDPAIIRPGRIDRHIEVTLPSKQARLKILKALSSSLHLDDDVDFKVFAEKMNNFTGADIMSFLTTANMDAVQQYLESDEADEKIEYVTITQAHLDGALTKTKPSIKPKDLERYKHTYAQFINKSEPTPLSYVGQKTSLA